jgi:hypothetical protein
VAASTGGWLTGALDATQRRALGRELITIPPDIGIVPFADMAWQMAKRHGDSASLTHALSTLSCEALVAADHLGAQICVWSGDDGPNLRAACQEHDVPYFTIG